MRSKPSASLLFSSWCVGLLSAACTHQHPARDWQGGVIKSAGTYISRPDSLRLDVSEADGLVRFAVSDRTGRHLFTSNRHASIHQKWALYLDRDRRVWDASADIGGVVWAPDSTGRYRSENINAALGKRMAIPKEVAFAVQEGE
jgi:hypothetical protein